MCKRYFTGQMRKERIKVKMRIECADPKVAFEVDAMWIAGLLSYNLCNRVVILHLLFNVPSVPLATLSVITRRKHPSHYENPGSGKKCLCCDPTWFILMKACARAERAFVLCISTFLLLPAMWCRVLPNCTISSAAQELTRRYQISVE